MSQVESVGFVPDEDEIKKKELGFNFEREMESCSNSSNSPGNY